ncbi:MAG: glycosyltransferase [Endomicrobiia bacterium]
MIKNYNIICFGFADWDNPYRTNQHHIMQRLSQNNRVVFVESLGLRQPVFQKKDIKRIFKRLIKGIKGLKKINENLYIYSPLVLPLHKFSFVRKINNLILKSNLKKIQKKLNFTEPIIWSYIPNIIDFKNFFNEKLIVYHCVDELSANPLIPAKVISQMEIKLIKNADVVFVSSKPLYEKKKIYNLQNTYYMPNVADFEHFSKVWREKEKLAVPEDIKNIKHPIIGFVGAISKYKINFSIIEYILQTHRDWSLVLIGAVGEGEKAVDISEFKYPNLYYLGAKAYSELPHYINCFDICILPSLINEYTKNMFPMKFFEYLSTGKPVVSVDLPSLEEFKKYFYCAKDKYEFVLQIEKAIKEDNEELKKNRIEIAKQFTWEKRIEEMSDIIEKNIKQRLSF